MRISGFALGLTMLALAAPAVALAGSDKPKERAPGAMPTPDRPDMTGGSVKPKERAPTAITGGGNSGGGDWYDRGMAAIRAKQPGRAIELIKPLLADFEKRYAEEKRRIFCAVNPEQSKVYLADAARGAFEAVAIEPGWCRAQYVRGFALIDLGKLDEALAVFTTLTTLAPKNSRYLSELGYILSDQKKYAEAVVAYKRAAEAGDLSPDGVDDEKCIGYRGMAYSLTKLGRLGDAEAAYRACLKIDPDNEEAKDGLESLEKERQDTV